MLGILLPKWSVILLFDESGYDYNRKSIILDFSVLLGLIFGLLMEGESTLAYCLLVKLSDRLSFKLAPYAKL
jgi:hypothetical protein